MSRTSTSAPRRRPLTLIALGVTTALTLTACGGGSGSGDDDSPVANASAAPKGVVTKEAAKKIVDTYEQVNNRANKTQDEKLLATVEAEQVHEQSRADYKLMKTKSAKEQKEYRSPFSYTDRTYYLPAAGTATWFAVKAKTIDSKDDGLLIFDKVGSAYKMVAALYLDPAIGRIAVDRNGLATAFDPAKRVGALAPNQLGAAYEDFFETGGTKAAKQLATTKTTEESVQVYKDRDSGDLSKFATKKFFGQDPAHPEVYALQLAGGGVVAVFPTAHTVEKLLKEPYRGSHQINPNKEEAVFNSTARIIITDEFQGQALAELTPQGKPKVMALEYRMVDSR
ncbi:hypothetical protein [Streptomyces sp. TRM68367]|uniref:hypothetical protein n=1 Tax=Streptomyces sp. TRM68367 TaxID=2758415 RepID=UPI00165BBA46|nr:hypothetical protein [Streptomyces sp. TRM68367]MBC9723603.1 hypothetical protein [Streptomyces sp. TRM68367]